MDMQTLMDLMENLRIKLQSSHLFLIKNSIVTIIYLSLNKKIKKLKLYLQLFYFSSL
ncbi:DUF645 family protein [Clostridium perfringens]